MCRAPARRENGVGEYQKNILSDASLLSKLKGIRGENLTAQTKEKLKKKRILNL